MAKYKVIYRGDYRTEAIHLKSGNQITTDAPTDNNGKGEAFSPTDLIAAGLASCMVTIMGIKADKNNFKLGDVECNIDKVMANNPRRIIGIKVKMEIKDIGYSEDEKQILWDAAVNCPVAKSLNKEISQELEVIYG